jgi:hypothetical protein
MHDHNTIELPETLEVITSRVSTPASTDEHRQTTDIAVYKYYFSAMGWFRVLVLVFLLVVDGGIGGLRSMSKLPSANRKCRTMLIFVQVLGLRCGPLAPTALQARDWVTGLECMVHSPSSKLLQWRLRYSK